MIHEKPCKKHEEFDIDCQGCWATTKKEMAEAQIRKEKKEECATFHDDVVHDEYYCNHEDCGNYSHSTVRHIFTEVVDPSDPRLKYGYEPRVLHFCCEHYQKVTGEYDCSFEPM